MSAQNQINAVTGTITGGIIAARNIMKTANKNQLSNNKNDIPTGKDLEMAAKARKEAQQKINAIMANKEISNKARTRRIGKVLDEYNKGGE